MPAQSKGVAGEVADVWQLLIAYLKQETIEEIKPLGRFVLWGVLGSLFLCLGLVLLTLAGLRALQTETGTTFTGNFSWAPYLITLAGAGVLAALSGRAITAGSRKDEK
jgi:hypothetical protein